MEEKNTRVVLELELNMDKDRVSALLNLEAGEILLFEKGGALYDLVWSYENDSWTLTLLGEEVEELYESLIDSVSDLINELGFFPMIFSDAEELVSYLCGFE